VDGVEELSSEVYQSRGKKKMIAVANAMAASAAYWIASAADELVVTPSGQIGSIGVFAAHEDISKAAEMQGVKVSLISAGKYKTEGNPFEPLSSEARAAMQRDVDVFGEMFTAAVARNRGAGAPRGGVRKPSGRWSGKESGLLRWRG
jgi:ClpP class serine protease